LIIGIQQNTTKYIKIIYKMNNINRIDNLKPSEMSQVKPKPGKEYELVKIEGKTFLVIKGSQKGGRLVLIDGLPYVRWDNGDFINETYVGTPNPPSLKKMKTYPRPVPMMIGGQMVFVRKEYKDCSGIELHKGRPYTREVVEGYMASYTDGYCGGEFLVYIGPGEDPQFRNLNKNLFVGTILVLGLLYLWFNLLF
jgi:hypothetical protein